jgi:hypothetical protein
MARRAFFGTDREIGAQPVLNEWFGLYASIEISSMNRSTEADFPEGLLD